MSTEAGANTSAIVLKGSDLDALSDDPDELQNELEALAGPSAGPNGGQIYIDGFTGGQLPPKSAIREIRINQNPFSAEFDRIGYGRIEILTKPGSDTLHGRFFGQGNDNAFNTGNPFTSNLPSYYSDQFNGTLSGPISKKASYFLSVEDRETQNDNVYSIPGRTRSTTRPATPGRSSKRFLRASLESLTAASSAPPIILRFRRASTCSSGRRTPSPCATSSSATTSPTIWAVPPRFPASPSRPIPSSTQRSSTIPRSSTTTSSTKRGFSTAAPTQALRRSPPRPPSA